MITMITMISTRRVPRPATLRAPLRTLVALIAIGVGCTAAPIVSDQSDGSDGYPGAQQALIEADRRRAAAMVAADPVALERLLSPELTYTHSTGLVEDRSELIRNLLRGEIDYRSIESPDPLVRLFGSVGVVSGHVDMIVHFRGEQIEVRSVYTAAYVLEAGGWRLVAYQSTSRPQDGP